jgi:hypothetical protein
MQQQFQFLVLVGFTTSILGNWIIFSSATYIDGVSKFIILLSIAISAWLFYWTFFTPAGKVFANYYNENAQKSVKQLFEDYDKFYRTKENIFVDIENFMPNQVIFSVNNKTGIAVDQRSKKICLLSNPIGIFPCDTRRTQRLIVPYQDILETALYEDGNSITKTSRTSQVAGAIVGNALIGGTGLIVGALTGSKKTSNTVQSLEIRITVNNNEFPFWAFAFLNSEISKNKAAYTKALEEANKFLSLVKVPI